MGWERDPYGIHELRYFSQGQPTKLVKDGNVEAYDDPPLSTVPHGPLAATGPATGSTATMQQAPVGQREALVNPDAVPTAGWYDDPTNPEQYRYWDGTGWTLDVHAVPVTLAPASPLRPDDLVAASATRSRGAGLTQETAAAGSTWDDSSALRSHQGQEPAVVATAGWYDDPSNPEQYRYWDGTGWTSHVHPPAWPDSVGAPSAQDDRSTVGVQHEPEPADVIQPGWYTDPTNPERHRYWDGTEWTSHVHPPEPLTTVDAPATAAQAQEAGPGQQDTRAQMDALPFLASRPRAAGSRRQNDGKQWYQRWWTWAAAGIVLIIIIAVANGSGNSGHKTGNASSAGATSSTTVRAATSPVQTTPPTTSPPPTSPPTTTTPVASTTASSPPTTAARPAAPPPQVLLQQSGTGNSSLPSFDARDTWQMAWSYDCTAYNSDNRASASNDSFSISINGNAGPSQSGDVSGSGTEDFRATGETQLQVVTPGCDWSIQVSQA